MGETHGQETKDRISAGSNRHGDRQHIIDEQRAAGNHACLFAKGVCGHNIPAAPGRKVFNDPGIGIGNDEYG